MINALVERFYPRPVIRRNWPDNCEDSSLSDSPGSTAIDELLLAQLNTDSVYGATTSEDDAL